MVGRDHVVGRVSDSADLPDYVAAAAAGRAGAGMAAEHEAGMMKVMTCTMAVMALAGSTMEFAAE